MNGIENITGKILAQANADVEQALAAARTQAAAINADYAAQAEKEQASLIERGRQKAEAARLQLGSAAQLEQRKALLAAKQQLVDEAFERAADRLEQLPPVDYAALLTHLAIANSGSGQEEVIFAAADRELIGPHVVKLANEYLNAHGRCGQLRLSAETGSFSKGLMLREGAVTVNCQVREILSYNRDRLAPEVAALLFG